MQVCEQRHDVAVNGRVYPSKSGNKPHKAYAWRQGAQEINGAFCSCQAFIFGRSKVAKAEGVQPQQVTFVCKHLQDIYENTCDWIQTQEREYRYDRTCPKCGGPVVEEGDDILIPEDDAGAVDDLRAMLAELSGEEPPPPIARPKPFDVDLLVPLRIKVRIDAMDELEASITGHQHFENNHGFLFEKLDRAEQISLGISLTEVVSATVERVTEIDPTTPTIVDDVPDSPKTVDPAGVALAVKALSGQVKPRRRS